MTGLAQRPSQEHLSEAVLAGFAQLEPSARTSAISHLDVCPECRGVLAEVNRTATEPPTRQMDPLIGQQIGEYRIAALIARGGMGAVYQAVQPVISRKVAIKVLLPAASQDPQLVRRFVTEARALSDVKHPNVIDVFAFGELPDGRHYLAMQLLEGFPLDELVRARHRLTAEHVLVVLEQLLSALNAAHAAGVIHRDLKPANIFVTPLPEHRLHVTVLDFGVARRLGATGITSPNIVVGTCGYVAPELLLGAKADARSDLYAVGAIAWQLLTGRRPFEAETMTALLLQHLEAPLPVLTPTVSDCPRALLELVPRLLAKRPEDRPQSAHEALLAIRAASRSAERSEPVPGPDLANRVTAPDRRPVEAAVPPMSQETPVMIRAASLGPVPEAPGAPSLAATAMDRMPRTWPSPPPRWRPTRTAWAGAAAVFFTITSGLWAARAHFETRRSPPTPSMPTTASVRQRLEAAREHVAALPTATDRALLKNRLSALEQRLAAGEAANNVARDLDALLGGAAPP